jgi:hypothetical protein
VAPGAQRRNGALVGAGFDLKVVARVQSHGRVQVAPANECLSIEQSLSPSLAGLVDYEGGAARAASTEAPVGAEDV